MKLKLQIRAMRISLIHSSTNPLIHLSAGRGGRVVYCGGLENRFGFTADGGSNPSLSASLIS